MIRTIMPYLRYHVPIFCDFSRNFIWLSPKQSYQHYVDGILNSMFFDENFHILIQIPLTIVSKGPIGNATELV